MQHLSFLWFETIRFETRSTQTITWRSTLKASAALWLNKSNNDGRTCVVLKVIWLPNPLQLLHTNSHPTTPSHPLYSLWKQSNLYSVQSDSIPGVIRKEKMRSWMPERADLVRVSSCMNFNHILFHTRNATILCSHKSNSTNSIGVEGTVQQGAKCIFARITARNFGAFVA